MAWTLGNEEGLTTPWANDSNVAVSMDMRALNRTTRSTQATIMDSSNAAPTKALRTAWAWNFSSLASLRWSARSPTKMAMARDFCEKSRWLSVAR